MQKNFLVLGFFLAIAGCSPIYYPNSPQTVVPVEAGEVIGSLTGGTGGIEARVSIAPAKHVVVAATGSYIHIPGKDSYIKHRYGELALGWSDTSGRAFYSFMGGAGMGYTATPPGSHLPWDNVTFDSARYVRVFAQAILGSLDHPRSIRDGERANTGFALGMRFAWVRASELWIDDQLLPPAGDFFIEPLIAWQHMGESFGTVVDLALAFNPAGGLQFHHSPIRIGVSLVYSLR